MDIKFSARGFVQTLAQDLIDSFAKAGRATTPGLVGSARERAVRNSLERLFPQAIGVSTGCVIDSENNTSNQTDIVMFEKEICPVFSINDNPDSSYFPCESVIAVGEIKSTIGTSEILDSFNKIESVKRLRRFGRDSICFRSYCSRAVLRGVESQRFDQEKNPLDQIYGFILCESIGLTLDTFLIKCKEEANKRDPWLVPNIIVSLNDGILLFINSKDHRSCTDTNGADSIYFAKHPEGNFTLLLSNLNGVISNGRTTDTFPFQKYILSSPNFPPGGRILYLKD